MVNDYNLHEDLLKSIHEFTHRQYERFGQSENDHEPLPATYAEMIIIALVDIGRPCSAEDINLWITRLLGADYREHRRSGYLNYPAKSLLMIGDLLTFSFDLPVELVSEHRALWTTPIRDAAPFLRRRLFSPWSPDKHFPIMKLPVELRASIFTYALALPPGARMRTKEPRRNSRGERWEIIAPNPRSSLKVNEVDPDFLALLRVSKAFYQEASPCFWSQELVVSGNAPKICRLLRAPAAWKYVQQIDLKLRDDGFQLNGRWVHLGGEHEHDDCNDEIAFLATMPRLRKMIVRLTPLRAYNIKEGLLEVPIVASLRRHIRGLKELVVHGPLQGCEDVLRAELMGPRDVSGVP